MIDLDRITDAQAVSRVLVCEALAANPRATRSVRTIARRIVAVYTDDRNHGLSHAEAFRHAWLSCRTLAEALGQAPTLLAPEA